jgi:hypothetical protein
LSDFGTGAVLLRGSTYAASWCVGIRLDLDANGLVVQPASLSLTGEAFNGELTGRALNASALVGAWWRSNSPRTELDKVATNLHIVIPQSRKAAPAHPRRPWPTAVLRLLPAGGASLGSQVALAGDAFGFLAPT